MQSMVDRILEEGYCASKEYVPSLYDSEWIKYI